MGVQKIPYIILCVTYERKQEIKHTEKSIKEFMINNILLLLFFVLWYSKSLRYVLKLGF